jgi:hypothetical protein
MDPVERGPYTARSIDVTGLPDEAIAAVEHLVSYLRHQQAGPGGTTPPFSSNEWKRVFDSWMGEVQARASRYPLGFVIDDSRESIYLNFRHCSKESGFLVDFLSSLGSSVVALPG